jgi:hypothetical protein
MVADDSCIRGVNSWTAALSSAGRATCCCRGWWRGREESEVSEKKLMPLPVWKRHLYSFYTWQMSLLDYMPEPQTGSNQRIGEDGFCWEDASDFVVQ